MISVFHDRLLYDAYEKLISEEKRFDSRGFNEFRKIEIIKLSENGAVTVKYGRTLVDILVDAEIVDLKDRHGLSGLVQFTFTGFTDERYDKSYFSSVFSKLNLVFSDSLVILKGEKAWKLDYAIDVLDNDGGVFTAAFAGLLLSLKTIRVPSHTNETGLLFHPSARKPLKVVSPSTSFVFVTVSCIDHSLFDIESSLLYDPTTNEALVTKSCIDVVIDNQGNVLYLNSINQGGDFGFISGLKDKCAHLFDTLNKVEIPCSDARTIAKPDEYMDHKYPRFEIAESGAIQTKDIELFELEEEKLTIPEHIISKSEPATVSRTPARSDDGWLLSSLSN